MSYPTLFQVDRQRRLRLDGIYANDREQAVVMLLDEKAAAPDR